ncbi:hypothetical protein HII36_50270 [Nonomuraea sp. NN258]|uniref:hypothetical protein n=1 Tax=Nonomuraea antri TaxID=2730852 RepID=UPI00156A3320|nr:hypothetical protein [Nonomuraea antri]NRQ39964.1 hypothetical protein [Nonomuraea antri]
MAQKHLTKSARFPVTWMRAELRRALGTSPLDLLPPAVVAGGMFKRAASAAVSEFATVLRRRSEAELLLGFPSAPFILPLASEDHRRFLEYAEERPDHAVRIRRRGMGAAAEWTLSPVDAVGAYELTFKLPEHIEEWISSIGEHERRRTVQVKEKFLSAITLYRVNGGGVRTYQLRYESSSLSRSGIAM